MATYMLHPASVDGDTIDCIQSVTPRDGSTVLTPLMDGNTESFNTVVPAANPQIEVATADIATALATIGAKGTTGAVIAFDALRTQAGGKSGTGAVKYTLATAYTTPRRITVANRGIASLTFLAEGYGAELVRQTSQSLSSHTPGSATCFGLGSLSVNGTAVAEVQSVDIDFGITTNPIPGPGIIYPAEILFAGQLPVVRFTTLSPGAFTGRTALNGSTGLVIGLRKYSAAAGGFIAAATEVHVKLTILNGDLIPLDTTGDPRVGAFEVRCKNVNAGTLISIDTASAL